MKIVVRLVEWRGRVGQLVISRAAATGLLGLLVAGAAGITATPGEARAEPPQDSIYARDGFYMGGRGVRTVEEFASDNDGAEGGWGFGAHVGYRFRRFLAAEVDIEVMDPGFSLTGGALRNIGLTAYAKAYPLSLLPARGDWLDRVQPYAKLGVGMQYFYSRPEGFDGTGFVARFGAGTDFYLTKQLALTFDATYIVPTGSIRGLNAWSLGVIGFQWRFSG